ncbi:hypothetical protein T492DRAFT_1074675 [Pavlovales sp. CCMP2436]|nr:hypothetical protein T492DRAFT_1074675 [Pavlovales sp. CCMP2436]|mmetsp:Transcript_44520/g.110317  ORF Transcript_44520/g.110317 Transcript_44520/m.110317 type:complete len:225 (+) Transcript_44520:36-710(+)
MAKRKAAQTVDTVSGNVRNGVARTDGMGQVVQQRTKALRAASTTSTSAAKAALDEPLRVTWLPLGADAARRVLDRVEADLGQHAELCARLRRAHAASMRLGRGDAPPAPTGGFVVGLNAVSAHMERGELLFAIVTKDAWPSACLRHLPVLAHVSGTPLCLLADAAAELGGMLGAERLDALGLCAAAEPWQHALGVFVRGQTPAVGAPDWFDYLPGLPPRVPDPA